MVRFGAGGHAGRASRSRATDGAHRLEVGFDAGRAEAAARSTARRVERAVDVAGPPARRRLPARPPRARQGRRRRRAGRTSTSSWPRCGRRARETRAAYSRALAQRNALVARIRAGAARPDAARHVGPELARPASQLMADRREALDARSRRPSPRAPPTSACPSRRAALPPALEGRRTPTGLARRARRAPRAPTSSAASPRHGPHRDDFALAARRPAAARATARRASSARPAGAAVRRARRAAGAARPAAADAARRRDVRARRRPAASASPTSSAPAGQALITTTDAEPRARAPRPRTWRGRRPCRRRSCPRGGATRGGMRRRAPAPARRARLRRVDRAASSPPTLLAGSRRAGRRPLGDVGGRARPSRSPSARRRSRSPAARRSGRRSSSCSAPDLLRAPERGPRGRAVAPAALPGRRSRGRPQRNVNERP